MLSTNPKMVGHVPQAPPIPLPLQLVVDVQSCQEPTKVAPSIVEVSMKLKNLHLTFFSRVLYNAIANVFVLILTLGSKVRHT